MLHPSITLSPKALISRPQHHRLDARHRSLNRLHQAADHYHRILPPLQPSAKSQRPSTANTMTRERTDSFRTPTSPASAAQMSPTAQKPKGVRRLLSLTNLRSSFSSSRTSLSLPRQSNDTNPYHTVQSAKRPASPGAASSFAPSTFTTTTSTTATGTRPPLREKKSGNWFKRKSSLFLLNGNGELYTVGEEGRPDTRESKRLKENPAPLLPEIGQLKGGRISGGDLGWDERAF